ncbi:M23 family metallopeptidase [Nocardioides donggukensis]|uniref:M23 family metallopeptidase n=1 Tax=Nocardioides donggukensis TaxID=2774019 RepID=A0A927Q123_9ACTN|nr:M23 family metallopeptidase [Nocardioides donggukensis]MBD8869597.1 M23 family metallopeptidase [Nocardioides donggukensis]
MQVRRSLVAAGVAVGIVLTAAPANAEPVTPHEMPFPCGQSWTGSTRDAHSPSKRAIDFNRPDDLNDPIVATAPGVVTTADTVADSGYGRWVVIDHGNDEKSLYAHMNTVMVRVGQRVDQGQQIGTLGSTGNSSGPHLHFEQRASGQVVWPYFSGIRYVFGSTLTSRNCVDVPLATNWVKGPEAEMVIFRRSTPSVFRIRRPDGSVKVKKAGRATDEPVLGDWDGNGRANAGIFRPTSQRFRLKVPGGRVVFRFGNATDKPVAGDWDGDGVFEVGTWDAARGEFALRSAGGAVTRVKLGDRDDLPVTGDWDGDGRWEVGVFDQATATYTLRKVDKEGIVWHANVPFGSVGDLPVTGDWDGNGRTDLGAWTPGTAQYKQRRAASPTSAMRSQTTIRFGRPR